MYKTAILTEPHMHNEQAARKYLESIRWPDGPVCPRCGPGQKIYRLTPKTGKREVLTCAKCRKQFSVKVGTIFEDSHIPLHKWIAAMHLMCASKKGMSAHQLHRMLGLTYKSAWFLAHRIRHAMEQGGGFEKMSGTVECDEMYLGGKRPQEYRDVNKMPVFSLVQRGGKLRSYYMPKVTAKNLRAVIQQHISDKTIVMTDCGSVYRDLKKHVFSHASVNHSAGEYVRGTVHVNTVESFFNILRRGIQGTYHHVSKGHLPRYLAEFDFRYNSRKDSDVVRAMLAMKQVEGKRLTYQTT